MSEALAKYTARVDAVNSLLCVGLDSNIARLSEAFQQEEQPQFAFNQHIIEQTHQHVAAYKFNVAFYEARGEQGWREMRHTVEYLRLTYPDIYLICDAKRGDIGNTSEAYARAIFDEIGFDAMTLHPYTGREALEPFLKRTDKGCIVLCRTSNPGSGEFQDLKVGEKRLWQIVAEQICHVWNDGDNCMLVVGATYPHEMAHIRALVGDMTLLVPGIGVQGGNVEQTVTAGLNSQGQGMIINSSRGIIFADDPGKAAGELKDAINLYRE